MSTTDPATRLRAAAFGADPDIDDSVLAAASTAPTLRSRWLAAVLLGARGRYAAAAALCDGLRRGPDPLYGSLAAATFAAHRRQLGGHAAALPFDALALRLGLRARTERSRRDDDGVDPDGAIADAVLGLAADNLALGRLAAARRLLARAAGHATAWRTSVRTGWVSAELALVRGDAAGALPHAERAAALAHRHDAVRHGVKSDLVVAAALAAGGREADRARAAELVDSALRTARASRLLSLTWPAGLLAADLDPAEAERNRTEVTRELYALLQAADPQGRRLALASPWVPL